MSPDLFSQAAPAADFPNRAICAQRELGAYEALWARQDIGVETIAAAFSANPGALPSDFASEAQIEKYSRVALAAIRHAGIQEFGMRVHGTPGYPPRLRDADHPVGLLYFQGNWELVNTTCVAVIGTREPSVDGRRRAAKLARLLVSDRYTVVSGLARGIDTVAHTAAIEAGGSTIGVLGTPITKCYPPENQTLQQHIAQKHLVISQVPIIRYSQQDVRTNSQFFPARNATMSALTAATIIVEAGEHSGALVQARHALKQKRKLFVLESCYQTPALRWPAILAEHGAIRVADYEDIRSHLAAPHARRR
jgi:DNA processing protein